MTAARRSTRLSLHATPWVNRALHLVGAAAARLNAAPEWDVVFVTAPRQSQGWILDAICREVAARLPGVRCRLCPADEPLPPSRRYFFSHYMYYVQALRVLSPVYRAHCYVFATHLEPAKHRIDSHQLAQLLNGSDGVICMNQALLQSLQQLGTAAEKLFVVVGAADPVTYRPHVRGPNGKVGFCSAYYERKSPDLVLDIVRRLPHRPFVLLGRGWDKYPHFDELRSMANFEYVEVPYTEYPRYYAQMSVFVSASELEGGPIPLLEAMMSNVVPVASRTGFAPDIIAPARNGYLFDVGSNADTVCPLIEQAYELDCDVHETVRHCSWDEFAAQLSARMGLVRNPDKQGA